MAKVNLKAKQDKLDSLGKTIEFIEEPKDINKYSIEQIVNHAITRYKVLDNIWIQRLPATRLSRKQNLGSSRSLEDLYLICKNYKSNVTIHQVVEALKNLPVETFYCYSFKKTMFRKTRNSRQALSAVNQFKKYV